MREPHRRVLHDGQTPLPLHENATGKSCRTARSGRGRSRGPGCRIPGNGGTRARRGRVPGQRRQHARRPARAKSRSGPARAVQQRALGPAPPVRRSAIALSDLPTQCHVPRRPATRAVRSVTGRGVPHYRTNGPGLARVAGPGREHRECGHRRRLGAQHARTEMNRHGAARDARCHLRVAEAPFRADQELVR